MMQKFKYIGVVILLIMLITPADAAFNLFGNVYQADGRTAVSRGLVEVLRVTDYYTFGTSGTSPFVVSGSNTVGTAAMTFSRLTEATGAISPPPGSGWLIGTTGPDTVIVRAWYGRTSQDQVPTASMYYGYSLTTTGLKDVITLGEAMAGVPNITKNVITKYKADAPNAPLACGIRVWYDSSFTPRVDVTCNHNSSPYDAEVVRTVTGDSGAPYVFTIAGAASRTYYSDTATTTISDLPVGSYTVSAQERNWFGLSTPGATQPFELRAAGAGGGAVSKTWTLNKLATGINTFSIPFDPNTAKSLDDTGRDIKTVKTLIEEIVRQTGGSPAVKVFGWYDSATQTHKGLTSIGYTGASVNAATTTATGDTVANILATTITMDTAYQASVDRLSIGGPPLTFTLKGTRP